MVEGSRMWAISLLTIMLITLISAAPIDITDDIKKEDVKADDDTMHSHDENVTRGGKFFGYNQFEIGNINVPGSVAGDDVSIGHEVNIDVHGHTQNHHNHEADTVIECKEGLREMFKSIDSNKDGLMDAMELLEVCFQNNIRIKKPLAVRILTLPDKMVGFNIAKFCELLKDCQSTNSADLIYFLLQLFDKGISTATIPTTTSTTTPPGGTTTTTVTATTAATSSTTTPTKTGLPTPREGELGEQPPISWFLGGSIGRGSGPAHLGVPDVKKCLGSKSMGSFWISCLPFEKPAACNPTSWKELMTLQKEPGSLQSCDTATPSHRALCRDHIVEMITWSGTMGAALAIHLEEDIDAYDIQLETDIPLTKLEFWDATSSPQKGTIFGAISKSSFSGANAGQTLKLGFQLNYEGPTLPKFISIVLNNRVVCGGQDDQTTTTLPTTTAMPATTALPVCMKEDNYDYWGNDIENKQTTGQEECANWCGAHKECKYWTLTKSDNQCWIKTSDAGRSKDNLRISGTKGCAVCMKEDNYDYMGNDIENRITTGQEECANWCGAHKDCKYWTLTKSNNQCWIKTSDAGRREDNLHISGTKGCAELKLDASDVPYLRIGSKWMPICGHYFWDNNNGADIFCRNLGYSQGGVVERVEGLYSEDAYYVGRCDSKSVAELENGCTKEPLPESECKKGNPVSIKVKCCKKENYYDYLGNDIENKQTGGPEDCANWCGAHKECNVWTLRKSDNQCWIKTSDAGRSKDDLYISGTKGCGTVSCPHKDDLSDVLLENNWRTQNQIFAMSEDDQRNTVIVEVEKMTGHTTEDLQGRANAGDLGSLTAIANMAALLIKYSIRSSSEVKTMTYEPHLRNTLIIEISKRFPVGAPQSKTDRQLLNRFCAFYTVCPADETLTSECMCGGKICSGRCASGLRCIPDRLHKGQKLLGDEFIRSQNEEYDLVMQSDGNLVIYVNYNNGRTPTWSTESSGAGSYLEFQEGDGNLVIYEEDRTVLWATDILSQSADSLVMQNDGDLVLYARNNALWASHTGEREENFICPSGYTFTSKISLVEIRLKENCEACYKEAKADGCSAWILSTALNNLFRASCDIHDLCYTYPGRSKADCDREQYLNMEKQCGSRIYCLVQAEAILDLHRTGVSNKAYAKAQKDAKGCTKTKK